MRFFNQKSSTTATAALTATQSSGSLGDLVSPTSPSSRGSLLGALCLTSAFLFGEGRSEAQQAQPFQGGNSASSGPLVQHTGALSEQDRQLLRDMLHHTGLVNPHRFEGIAGLRAYRALGRPPANSAAARAEHLASQMLKPFDHPFTNPDGKIFPPSILVVGGLTSIQSMFGSFGGAYRNLVNHQDQIKNSVAISDLLGVLQGAQKTQALQEDKILGWLNDTAHTLRLNNPELLPVLSAEAAYVNSKLPRVLVHELAKDFNGYLREACHLRDNVCGMRPPKDTAEALQLIQRLKLLFEQSKETNYVLHTRIVGQLSALELPCQEVAELELAWKEALANSKPAEAFAQALGNKKASLRAALEDFLRKSTYYDELVAATETLAKRGPSGSPPQPTPILDQKEKEKIFAEVRETARKAAHQAFDERFNNTSSELSQEQRREVAMIVENAVLKAVAERFPTASIRGAPAEAPREEGPSLLSDAQKKVLIQLAEGVAHKVVIAELQQRANKAATAGAKPKTETTAPSLDDSAEAIARRLIPDAIIKDSPDVRPVVPPPQVLPADSQASPSPAAPSTRSGMMSLKTALERGFTVKQGVPALRTVSEQLREWNADLSDEQVRKLESQISGVELLIAQTRRTVTAARSRDSSSREVAAAAEKLRAESASLDEFLSRECAPIVERHHRARLASSTITGAIVADESGVGAAAMKRLAQPEELFRNAMRAVANVELGSEVTFIIKKKLALPYQVTLEPPTVTVREGEADETNGLLVRRLARGTGDLLAQLAQQRRGLAKSGDTVASAAACGHALEQLVVGQLLSEYRELGSDRYLGVDDSFLLSNGGVLARLPANSAGDWMADNIRGEEATLAHISELVDDSSLFGPFIHARRTYDAVLKALSSPADAFTYLINNSKLNPEMETIRRTTRTSTIAASPGYREVDRLQASWQRIKKEADALLAESPHVAAAAQSSSTQSSFVEPSTVREPPAPASQPSQKRGLFGRR